MIQILGELPFGIYLWTRYWVKSAEIPLLLHCLRFASHLSSMHRNLDTSSLRYSTAGLHVTRRMSSNLPPCLPSRRQSNRARGISPQLHSNHIRRHLSITPRCRRPLRAEIDRKYLRLRHHHLSNRLRADEHRPHLHLWVIGQGWTQRRVLGRSVTRVLFLNLKVLCHRNRQLFPDHARHDVYHQHLHRQHLSPLLKDPLFRTGHRAHGRNRQVVDIWVQRAR